MTTYSVVLFLHIVSAFGILVSLGLEWMSLVVLQRSCTAEQIREAMKWFDVLPRIGGPSFAVALLSGIYLWESAWRGTAWTLTALVSLVVMALVGAVLTGPRMASIGKMIAGKTVREPGALQLLHMPVLWASFQVRLGIAIGITFLMSVKPGLAGSVLAVAVAILLGLAMNPATVNHYRRLDACAVKSRQT